MRGGSRPCRSRAGVGPHGGARGRGMRGKGAGWRQQARAAARHAAVRRQERGGGSARRKVRVVCQAARRRRRESVRQACAEERQRRHTWRRRYGSRRRRRGEWWQIRTRPVVRAAVRQRVAALLRAYAAAPYASPRCPVARASEAACLWCLPPDSAAPVCAMSAVTPRRDDASPAENVIMAPIMRHECALREIRYEKALEIVQSETLSLSLLRAAASFL